MSTATEELTALLVLRASAKLTDPNALFTSDEVAALMGQAQRWGYEARQDEENEAYRAQQPVMVFGRWYDQAIEREKADAEVRELYTAQRAA